MEKTIRTGMTKKYEGKQNKPKNGDEKTATATTKTATMATTKD